MAGRSEGSGERSHGAPRDLRSSLRLDLGRFEELRRSNPSEARRLLPALRRLADEIREHPRSTPAGMAEDLRLLHRFYRSALDLMNGAPGAPRREIEEIQSALRGTEEAMRTFRTWLQSTLALPEGATASADQLGAVRLAIEVSRELGDGETAASDFRRYQGFLNGLPRERLEGPAGHGLLADLLRFAVDSQNEGDSPVSDMAFHAADRFVIRLPRSERMIGHYQILAAAESVSEGYGREQAQIYRRVLDRYLTSESASPELRRQRAFEQGYAILWMRAQGQMVNPSETLLNTLHGGGRILSGFADVLDPQSAVPSTEALASLSSLTPRTVTEELVVRLAGDVNAQRAGFGQRGFGPADPLARAVLSLDSSAYRSVARLAEITEQIQALTSAGRPVLGADLQRSRQLLAQAQEVRAEIDSSLYLSEDRSLRTHPLETLLRSDRAVLALRRQIDGGYGGAPAEFLGESDQVYADRNGQLEREVARDVERLQELRREALGSARDQNGPVTARVFNYRLVNRIDAALNLGNERVTDLVEWQTLILRASDAEVPPVDRFNDLGEIVGGLHILRQRHYDERSLDLRDTRTHWDLSPTARVEREAREARASATPDRVRMSEADLTQHMRQAETALNALLPQVHSGEGSAEAQRFFRERLHTLVSARPGSAAVPAAEAALPLLSLDGLETFAREPALRLAILDELTGLANRHLAQGHMTAEILRDPSQTLRMSDGHRETLSHFIQGTENGRIVFTPAYQSLSLDDRRQVIQQVLHVARLGEYRTALDAETDPVRRHFRQAMVSFEEGDMVRGQEEIQTFLRDLRGGDGPVLQPIADATLSAMRTVAVDLNRRFLNQSLDRLQQVDQELDAQRETNLGGFLSRDFGSNEAAIARMRSAVDDPQLGFYSLDEVLIYARHQYLVAIQNEFGSSDRVGMRIEGSSSQQFGAQGLIPNGSTSTVYAQFQAHPEQAIDGVPTVVLSPRGELRFEPHQMTEWRPWTSLLRVQVPAEGGAIVIHYGDRTERRVFPPSSGAHYVLIFENHASSDTSRRRGILDPAHPGRLPPGTRGELDGMLMHVFNFEGYSSLQERAQSPDVNRRASLRLAQSLRDRNGSYAAAAQILEEVMGDVIHRVEQTMPRSEVERIQRQAEASRGHFRERVLERVFRMVDHGMPRPTQSQIDQMIEQAVQDRIQTQRRQWVFRQIRDCHDRNQLDPISREAWETYNNMMDPLREWLTFSDAAEDRIMDEVLINLAFTLASGGLATAAGGLTRAAATRLAGRWLAAEGVNIVGERAALWAASQGGRRLLGRAAVWAMGEAATQSGRQIAARLFVWAAGVTAEGLAFHTSMTGMQSAWGFVRNGEWVFPEPREFARGAWQSILMMGSLSVGNAVWGRVAEEIGVSARQVEQLANASRTSRIVRQAVNYTGQLTTEAAAMTLTGEGEEGFGVGFLTNVGTILQLRLGGRLFGLLTGQALERYQANLENRILQDRLSNLIERRLGIDPQSPEGRMMVQAANAQLANGGRVGAVEGSLTRANLETVRDTVRREFNLDPATGDGQAMTALLLMRLMTGTETAGGLSSIVRGLIQEFRNLPPAWRRGLTLTAGVGVYLGLRPLIGDMNAGMVFPVVAMAATTDPRAPQTFDLRSGERVHETAELLMAEEAGNLPSNATINSHDRVDSEGLSQLLETAARIGIPLDLTMPSGPDRQRITFRMEDGRLVVRGLSTEQATELNLGRPGLSNVDIHLDTPDPAALTRAARDLAGQALSNRLNLRVLDREGRPVIEVRSGETEIHAKGLDAAQIEGAVREAAAFGRTRVNFDLQGVSQADLPARIRALEASAPLFASDVSIHLQGLPTEAVRSPQVQEALQALTRRALEGDVRELCIQTVRASSAESQNFLRLVRNEAGSGTVYRIETQERPAEVRSIFREFLVFETRRMIGEGNISREQADAFWDGALVHAETFARNLALRGRGERAEIENYWPAAGARGHSSVRPWVQALERMARFSRSQPDLFRRVFDTLSTRSQGSRPFLGVPAFDGRAFDDNAFQLVRIFDRFDGANLRTAMDTIVGILTDHGRTGGSQVQVYGAIVGTVYRMLTTLGQGGVSAEGLTLRNQINWLLSSGGRFRLTVIPTDRNLSTSTPEWAIEVLDGGGRTVDVIGVEVKNNEAVRPSEETVRRDMIQKALSQLSRHRFTQGLSDPASIMALNFPNVRDRGETVEMVQTMLAEEYRAASGDTQRRMENMVVTISSGVRLDSQVFLRFERGQWIRSTASQCVTITRRRAP